MPTPSVLPARLAAALVPIALIGGCSASSSHVSTGPTPLREAVDVVTLHEHRTDFLGDASSVTALAGAAGVSEVGDRTFALTTDRRPYVLTIQLTSLAEGITPARADRLMRDRATLLLATIGNADEVRWTLPDGADTGNVMTRTAADELAGTSVAVLGATVGGLEDLVEHLEG